MEDDKPAGRLNLKRAVLLVVLMTLFFFALDMVWRLTNRTPAHWDMARHLATSFDYYGLFRDGRFGSLALHYFYYPPFYYWVSIPFYLIFDLSIATATASNFVFLLMLALSTFFIARKAFGIKWGPLASFIVLTFPMLSAQFKEFQLDAPLAAVVMLSLALLYHLDDFRQTKPSLFFGLAVALGMLTKWTFFVFILPAALYVLARGLIKKDKIALVTANALSALALVILIAGPWYWRNKHQLRLDFNRGGIGSALAEGDPIGLTWPAFTFYFWTFAENHFWLLGTLLAFVSLVVVLVKRELRAKLAITIISIIFGYLAFFKFDNKDARYIMPVVTQFAVVIAGFVSILAKKPRRMLIMAIAVFGLFAFCQTTFAWPFKENLGFRVGPKHTANLFTAGSYTLRAPNAASWHFDDIFTQAKADSDSDKTIQFMGHDRLEFNRWDLAYYSKIYGLEWVGEDLSKIAYHYEIFRQVSQDDLKVEETRIRDFDYNSTVMGEWSLPDGSRAYLLKMQKLK